MMIMKKIFQLSCIVIIMLACFSCGSSKKSTNKYPAHVRAAMDAELKGAKNSVKHQSTASATKSSPKQYASIKNVSRHEFVKAAMKYVGYPYKFGGKDPQTGFDCSGLIFYILNTEFGVVTPRTSGEFANWGKTIPAQKMEKGDLLIFGSYGDKSKVGHIGIVSKVANNQVEFVHAASSNTGVIVSKMEGYWITNYIKTISIFD